MKRHVIGSYCSLRNLRLLLFLIICPMLLWNCVTFYDQVTDQNLTELKSEVLALYDTFTGNSLNVEEIDAIKRSFVQILGYEKNKGKRNADTVRQIEIIQQMFEGHVDDRRSSGKWSTTHLNNQKENIAEAFDIAIQTENLKPRCSK